MNGTPIITSLSKRDQDTWLKRWILGVVEPKQKEKKRNALLVIESVELEKVPPKRLGYDVHFTNKPYDNEYWIDPECTLLSYEELPKTKGIKNARLVEGEGFNELIIIHNNRRLEGYYLGRSKTMELDPYRLDELKKFFSKHRQYTPCRHGNEMAYMLKEVERKTLAADKEQVDEVYLLCDKCAAGLKLLKKPFAQMLSEGVRDLVIFFAVCFGAAVLAIIAMVLISILFFS